ncbi:hypothetical protein PFICI_12451 [Pestalotiopsis fici W106-1]|uniref:Uncharacterized protein n=1 Tax=Pestalotiopsis fici (strain W106-1 / CGMCC3.15140) TaxID=1229662 RepID=W3WQS6_PESFW|nr:uncharacterized protein PFICI_12451 [Pestalotiopsis fici W106-1]ETS75507.1 hypothetical protein PFICI_12451 [Pestalotiopsis fici W106-1]
MSEGILRPAFQGREKPLISYGLPFDQALAKHVESIFHASRVFLIVSKSLATNTSCLDAVRAALGEKLAGIRIGMKPHTQWTELVEIITASRSCNADLLVTLGAGSLTDAAKVISLGLENKVESMHDLERLHPEGTGHCDDTKIATTPVVCIPTSLSGGEYSASAGATNDETGRKWAFSYQAGVRCPHLVILDPELSATTPEHIWLSTGIKAVDHCVETLCSLGSDGEADEDARKGLRQLIPGLLGCRRDKVNTAKRLECQLGVIDAMSACSRGVPLGASHGIGHQLGPVGVGHGETSCILLPAVCRYNYTVGANKDRQVEIAKLLWGIPEAIEIFQQRNFKQEQTDLSDLLDAVIRALGMPRSLKEFGISEDSLNSIAEHSLKDRWVQSNPANLDKNGVLEILRMIT